MTATLNLATVAGLQNKLLVELDTLHEAFRQLPVFGSEYIDTFKNPSQNHLDITSSFMGNSSEQIPELLINQVIYLQTGYLLGKSQEELFARFVQRLSADIARQVDPLLDKLANSTISESSALEKLLEIMPSNYSSLAVELLEQHAIRCQYHPIRDRSVINLFAQVWLRAADDEFLESFTRVLRNRDAASRQVLLNIFSAVLDQIRCTELTQLEPLLAWADEELASDGESGLKRGFLGIVPLLSMLAQGNDKVSLACQQQVVQRLESIQSLSNRNYWFSEVNIDRRYGQPWRVAQLRQAIEVLQDETPDADGTLLCHALIAVRAGLENLDEDLKQLPEANRSNLIAALRSRLQAATKDLDAHTRIHPISVRFGEEALPIFSSTGSARQSSQRPTSWPAEETRGANPTILLLNLLIDSVENSEISLCEELKTEVKELHRIVENLNITSRDFSNLLSRMIANDHSLGIKLFASESAAPGLIQHIWFVQTGSLLGKNLQELAGRPYRLYVAEQNRKARLVQPGDTLAIHIPGVLPQSGEPPVFQAGTAAPVTGFPVPVSADGTIQLPLLSTLEVKDLELNQVREVIVKAYSIETTALRSPGFNRPTVQFLLRAGQQVELRNITGNVPVTPPQP